MNYIVYLVFAILIYMHFETRRLEVSNIKLTFNKGKLKILHISDIHFNRMFVSFEKIREVVSNASPDCVVLTGDYFDNVVYMDKFIDFLLYINQSKIPTFIVYGNHEFKSMNSSNLDIFKIKIEKVGIKVLVDENCIFEKEGKKCCFIGINDLIYGNSDVKKAFSCVDNSFLNIVLTHNPDTIFEISNREFDLMLSGHFHGGQIYMPFHFEVKMLRNEKLSKMKIIKGLHKINGKMIYISRGIGNVLFPLRLFSKPEITVFQID